MLVSVVTGCKYPHTLYASLHAWQSLHSARPTARMPYLARPLHLVASGYGEGAPTHTACMHTCECAESSARHACKTWRGRARLVEQLHHDEGVEDERVVHAGALYGRGRRHAEQRVAVEDERAHGRQLERALARHRLQHLAPRRRSISVRLPSTVQLPLPPL